MKMARLADLYRRMVDIGATTDMIAIMLEAYESGGNRVDERGESGGQVGLSAHDKRKAWDREYQARRRADKKSGGNRVDEALSPDTSSPSSSSPLTPPLSPAPLSPPIIPPSPLSLTLRESEQTLPGIDPPSKPPEKAPQRFDEFWAAYPRRAGTNSRKAAAERYRRAVVRGVEEAAIIAGAARYAAFCDAEGNTGTQFVQQTTTWLNQEGWTNDYPPSRKRQSELMDAFDRVGEKLQRAGGNQGSDGPGGEGHRPLRGYDPPF